MTQGLPPHNLYIIKSGMDVAQEEPPDLVDVGAPDHDSAPDALQSQLEDLSLSKVPLTIVTGIMPTRMNLFLI